MALKIRLRQQGRNNRATYRLVVTDCRSPRDGKYVEMLGWYCPFESVAERTLSVKSDRVQHWLDLGAQMTDKAKTLIAQIAPEVVKEQVQKQVAHRAKMASKRKAQGKSEGKSEGKVEAKTAKAAPKSEPKAAAKAAAGKKK